MSGVPSGTRDDARWMSRALERALEGRGRCNPNPMVGAVVVRDGRAVGEGFHAVAGGPHAEVVALRAAGDLARGATLYVTLEPCNHVGRTPPCVDAVIAAGVRRVVAAVADPNPRVRGNGAAALSKAGIEVLVGCLGERAREDNRAFFTAMERRRPHVTLKWAMTLDGKIAARDGRARWITGPDARLLAHRMRAESDAVMVGIGTALADDPALDVRLDPPWPRQPWRVVVDSRGRLPATARVLGTGDPRRAVVAVTDAAPIESVARLEAAGATVLGCKSHDGRVDPADLLGRLAAMDVNAVLVEGGGGLHGALVDTGLCDRVAVFVAPMLLGGHASPTPLGGRGLLLPDALRLRSVAVRPLGPDWLLEGDVVHPEAAD